MSDSDDDDSDAFIQAQGKVVVTDLIGLGAAAKAPAAKEIVAMFHRLLHTFAGPLHTRLQGAAETSVRSRAMVADAKAEVEAELIREEGCRRLMERAGRRVALLEGVKQINLEAVVREAVETVEKETPDATPRNVDPDWTVRWAEGAQYASSDEVRRLWARVMVSKATSSQGDVHASSLALLVYLDKDLAIALEEFAKTFVAYGCFPNHGKATFSRVTPEKLGLLAELGFLVEREQSVFSFDDFDLRFGAGKRIKFLHTCYLFSRRGFEICGAVFGSGNFTSELPGESQRLDELEQVILAALEIGPRPVLLNFMRTGTVSGSELAITLDKGDDQPTPPVPSEMIAQLTDFSRKLLNRLARKMNVTIGG